MTKNSLTSRVPDPCVLHFRSPGVETHRLQRIDPLCPLPSDEAHRRPRNPQIGMWGGRAGKSSFFNG